MKVKVAYSGAWYDDCHPFNVLAKDTAVARTPDDLKEHDSVLIIWGGADIHPDYYKHAMHSSTHPGGARDRVEWGLIQQAIEKSIPIIGVCRGAQMLTAAAGGWLIQDVRGHAGFGGHEVTTHDGKTFNVNSIHHQMMVPIGTNHQLLAWSSEQRALTKRYDDRPVYATAKLIEGKPVDTEWTPTEGWVEPEFIYYPKINGYAIQWHPESMASSSDATKYILDFINKTEDARNERHSVAQN